MTGQSLGKAKSVLCRLANLLAELFARQLALSCYFSSEPLVSVSRDLVLRGSLFSLNVVPKPRMLSVPTVYVLGPLHLTYVIFRFLRS